MRSYPGLELLGAGLAIARNRTVDQLRELGAQAGVVQPVFCQPAGFEILHQDIGLSGEAADLGLTLGDW